MQITRLLKVSGAMEPNAVMLNDEGEEYPVFLKSLHNTIYFQTMLDSGYKLAGLPYDFVKDGKSIMELPAEVYAASEKELQMMYDSVGTPIEHEELLSHIDVSVVRGLATPPTNYTIHTREEFIEYLDKCYSKVLEEDFYPINYFVAPEARFSAIEFTRRENAKYIKVIQDRRTMSLQKFYALVEWLQQFGLTPNASFTDVLDAYFAWGYDGLNMTLVSKHREMYATRLVNSNEKNEMTREIYGLIDGKGNVYPPLNERNVRWKTVEQDPALLQRMYGGIMPNQTKMLQLTTSGTQDVVTYEGTEGVIRFSDTVVILLGRSFRTIMVTSPANSGTILPYNLALPAKKKDMLEYCQAEALARYSYKKRRDNTIVSSYQVMKWAGLLPEEAICYILTNLGMLKTSDSIDIGGSQKKAFNAANDLDSMPAVFMWTVHNFLMGERREHTLGADGDPVLNEDDTIMAVLNGEVNVDNIAIGIGMDNNVNIAGIRNTILTVHNTMNVPMETMYKDLCSASEDDKVLVMRGADLEHNFSLAPIDAAVRGYKQDLKDYEIRRSKHCSWFYYITLVAREVSVLNDEGKPASDRAVGAEFLFVNLYHNTKAEGVLETLVKQLCDAVFANASLSKNDRDIIMSNSKRWAFDAWFEIYFQGRYTMPKVAGAQRIPAPAYMLEVVRSNTFTKIDSLPALCTTSIADVGSSKMEFMSYCVNAYVSYDYVIPKSPNRPIKEIPFYAAWVDYSRKSPAIWQALIKAGVYDNKFVAWECRYADQQLYKPFDEDDLAATPLRNPMSLMVYYERAVKYIQSLPANKPFTAVPHIVDYLYPGINKPLDMGEAEIMEDVEEDVLAVPRTAPPVIKLGAWRILRKEMFDSIMLPVEQRIEPDIYIKKFIGFDVDALFQCDNIFDKIPKWSGIPMLYMPETEQFVLLDSRESIHYTRVINLDQNRYPVRHVYDRIWLVRAADGVLWEVRV